MPFIFQLPATSGRMPGVIVICPSFGMRSVPLPYQNGATKQSTAGPEGRYCPSLPSGAADTMRANTERDMLDILRSAAGTWVAKLLLLLLVVSFAVWGISGQHDRRLRRQRRHRRPAAPRCRSTNTASPTTASSSCCRSSSARASRASRRRRSASTSRCWRSSSPAPCSTSRRASWARPLEGPARASSTAEDPAFQGPDGKFDRQQFEYVLRQVGMRARGLSAATASRSRSASRSSRRCPTGCKAPDAFLRRRGALPRRGPHGRLSSCCRDRWSSRSRSRPTTCCQTWFEENKATYAAPEYRKIAYVKLEPEDIADPPPISDEQVEGGLRRAQRRATRRRRRARSSRSSSRRRTPPRRRSSASQTGATFEDIVAGAGQDAWPTCSSARFAKDKIADPAVAEAAFALQANEVSEVVDGRVRPGAGARHRDHARGGASRSTRCRPRSARNWRSPRPTASCSTCRCL